MMLLRTVFLSLCLSLLCAGLKAAPTTIDGHAPHLAGKLVQVFGWHDFIAKEQELLDSVTIDVEGNFSLAFELSEVRYVELQSDYTAANLYVQAGTAYDIEFPPPGDDQSRSFGKKAQTEVIFNNLDLDDINARIIDFNYNYELFFQENYDLLRKLFSPRNYAAISDSASMKPSSKGSLALLLEATKAFEIEMDSLYKSMDDPYFELYRSSVLGDLMMNSPATARDIFETYIEPYPYNAQHPEFAKLLGRFYKHYLARYAQSYGDAELKAVVHETGSYAGLYALLEKDDFLRQAERRDVAILYAITEVWPSNAIRHAAMAQVLDSMQVSGASVVSRTLAAQVSHKLRACKKGFAPRDISFEDQYNDRHQISDLRGEVLLIEFWAPWCTSCKMEQGHLASIMEERYGKTIQVLSVKVSDTPSTETERADTEDYLHTYTVPDSEWLRSYEVLSLPHYVLIGADGKVMRDNTPLPSAGLEALLHRIKTETETKPRRRIGQ